MYETVDESFEKNNEPINNCLCEFAPLLYQLSPTQPVFYQITNQVKKKKNNFCKSTNQVIKLKTTEMAIRLQW